MTKKAANNRMIKLTLKRSVIGRSERQRACIKALGLRKINSISLLKDSPQVRGLIQKVHFMVSVDEVAI